LFNSLLSCLLSRILSVLAPPQSGGQKFMVVHDARHPGLGVPHYMDVVLQNDLLGGMLEADCGQPPPVGNCPTFLAGMDAAMAKQKSLQLLTGPGDVAHRVGA
jgi:hypothetical protein